MMSVILLGVLMASCGVGKDATTATFRCRTPDESFKLDVPADSTMVFNYWLIMHSTALTFPCSKRTFMDACMYANCHGYMAV